jgi:hypothetical protein
MLGAIVLGVAIGWAAGGRLAGVTGAGIRWSPLALTALLAQVLISAAGRSPVTVVALIATFAVLACFALRNRHQPGFPLVLAGLLMNLAVIVANGAMPVSGRALELAGIPEARAGLLAAPTAKHRMTRPGDRLVPLADVVPVPVPPGEVVSAGDVVVDAGIVWFLAGAMRRRPRRTPDGTVTAARERQR